VGGRVGALEGMTVESLVLAVPSAAYLIFLGSQGLQTFTGFGAWHIVVIIVTGPATAIPLILFSAAARRIPLSWVGMLQSLTPRLQFSLGIAVLGAAMSTPRWIGFFAIWIAVSLPCTDRRRHCRRRWPADRHLPTAACPRTGRPALLVRRTPEHGRPALSRARAEEEQSREPLTPRPAPWFIS